MPQNLFGDVLVRPGSETSLGSRRSSIVLSIAAHSALVVAVLVVPLLAGDKLPIPQRAIDFILDSRVMPTVPEPPRSRVAQAQRRPDVVQTAPPAAPTDAPTGIAPESRLTSTPGSGGFSGPPQIGAIEGIQ